MTYDPGDGRKQDVWSKAEWVGDDAETRKDAINALDKKRQTEALIRANERIRRSEAIKQIQKELGYSDKGAAIWYNQNKHFIDKYGLDYVIDADRNYNSKTNTAYSNELIPGLFRKTKNIGDFVNLEEPMTLKHVNTISKEMGFERKGYRYKIDRNPELIGSGYCGYTRDDGKIIILYPDAFENRETLVKTLGHEHIHLQQILSDGKVKSVDELNQRENEARGSEEGWWNAYVKKTGYRS